MTDEQKAKFEEAAEILEHAAEVCQSDDEYLEIAHMVAEEMSK